MLILGCGEGEREEKGRRVYDWHQVNLHKVSSLSVPVHPLNSPPPMCQGDSLTWLLSAANKNGSQILKEISKWDEDFLGSALAFWLSISLSWERSADQDESRWEWHRVLSPLRLEECLFPHPSKLPRIHYTTQMVLGSFPLILVINSLTCTEHMPNPCPRHKNGFIKTYW